MSPADLTICREIHTGLTSKERNNINYLFLDPVDTNIFPQYTQVIKKPMDLRTLKTNLESTSPPIYSTKEEFYTDAKLIFSNAIEFNKDSSQKFVVDFANRMMKAFERLRKNSEKKQARLAGKLEGDNNSKKRPSLPTKCDEVSGDTNNDPHDTYPSKLSAMKRASVVRDKRSAAAARRQNTTNTSNVHEDQAWEQHPNQAAEHPAQNARQLKVTVKRLKQEITELKTSKDEELAAKDKEIALLKESLKKSRQIGAVELTEEEVAMLQDAIGDIIDLTNDDELPGSKRQRTAPKKSLASILMEEKDKKLVKVKQEQVETKAKLKSTEEDLEDKQEDVDNQVLYVDFLQTKIDEITLVAEAACNILDINKITCRGVDRAKIAEIKGRTYASS